MSYPVGGFFVVPVGGWGGVLIRWGQRLAGASPEAAHYCHAGVITSADGDTVEAQPGGAVVGHMSEHAGALVCDAPALLGGEDRRELVAACARARIGIGYSALDYLALALLHLGLPNGWVRRRVQASRREICSQLVDASLSDANLHLFGHRLPGDVMPADLARWAIDHQETHASL